jgi:hypothetical protein
MIQFAILGTLGDFVSAKIAGSKENLSASVTVLKALEWAFLSIFIKIAFIGYEGFVSALVINRILPTSFAEDSFLNAVTRSASMNLQFGVFLVLFHRLLDNLILHAKNWKNVDKALYSPDWFLASSYTLTYLLPKDFQIGLAAYVRSCQGLMLSNFKVTPGR